MASGLRWRDDGGNVEIWSPFELSAAVSRAYERALRRYGPVDGELPAVALVEEQAGVSLRRRA